MSQQKGPNPGNVAELEIAPPANVPLAGSIHIVQLADGRILCKAAVSGRVQFNLMIETAKQDMVQKYMEQERKQGSSPIIEAPPGFKV